MFSSISSSDHLSFAFSMNCSISSSLYVFKALSLFFLPGVSIISESSFLSTSVSNDSRNPSGAAGISSSHFSIWNSLIISFWKATSDLIASCAASSAPTITSSETSFASPSTIATANSVPATTISSSDLSSSSAEGNTTYFPSIYPTCTPATIPSKGIGEIFNASDDAIIPQMSGGLSGSADRTVTIT